MSEKLLRSLMHLFALLAREGGVTREENQVVRAFLQQQLTQAGAEQYLSLFQEYAAQPSTLSLEQLAVAVNRELTQKQKVVVVTRLLELINADQSISTEEASLMAVVARSFALQPAEYEALYAFASSATPHLVHNPLLLRIGPDMAPAYGAALQLVRSHYPSYLTVLHLPSVDAYLLRYVALEEVSVNGLNLRPGTIYLLAPGSVLRVQKHPPVYYSDIVSHFLQAEDHPAIHFEAEEVVYQFASGQVGLHGVTLRESAGCMVGLMGGSGAGKSTLLNVLNGNLVPTQGTVRINGVDLHTHGQQLEGVIGYVSQDDLLIEELSVYQNLYFNARLCFAQLPPQALEQRVLSLLSSLGLQEIKDLKVGSPLNKKISGGQRKRLNIALELIREPAVLFVDEPTSGLSSRDSENIMDLLKELALKGKLVFVVIHQPSSDIFKMFDRLYILDVGGYPIYYGNPVEAITYVKQQAQLIDADASECVVCGNVNPEQVFNVIETKLLDEDGNFTQQRKYAPQQWHKAFLAHITLPKPLPPAPGAPPKSLQLPSRLRQAGIFLQRDVLAKLSNRPYLLINLLEAPLLAAVLAFLLRYFSTDAANSLGYTLYDNVNLPAYLFICVLVALFVGLTVSAEEILRDRKLLRREAFLHLSRQSYLLSKVALLFVLSAVQTLSFVLIGNLILGIHGMTLPYWAVLFSTACFANLLGLNISATFDSAVTIYILVPLLLIPQIILSGTMVRFDKLNPSVSRAGRVPLAADLMVSRWAYEALAVAQFRDNAYERRFYVLDKAMSQAEYRQTFWLPRLQAKLDYATDHPTGQLGPSLQLLANELGATLSRFKGVDAALVQQLTPGSFTPAVGQQTQQVLQALKTYYSGAYNTAAAVKDKLLGRLQADSAAKQAEYGLKLSYHNESLTDLVTNRTDEDKVLEVNGRLVQNMDPIFQEPAPRSAWDFRTHFFAPSKPFAGQRWDTLSFNLAIIWLMTGCLYLTLSGEVFRKLLSLGQARIKARRRGTSTPPTSPGKEPIGSF